MYCCESLGEWLQLSSYNCIRFRTYEDIFIIQRCKNKKRDVIAFSFIPLNVHFTFERRSAFNAWRNPIFFIHAVREHLSASVNILLSLVHTTYFYVRD